MASDHFPPSQPSQPNPPHKAEPALFGSAELERRRVALARLTPVLFVVWVLGVLASFLGVLQSVRRIPVGFLLLLPVMVFVEVLVLTAIVSVGRRALRLVCPSCGKVMVSYDQPAGRLTLARGRCSGCGRLLVGETASGRPERVPPPTTPLGFVERRDRLEAASRRDYVLSILMAAAGLVAGWIGATALLRTGARLFIVAGAPLLSLILVLFLLFLLEQRWEARARALGLVCAHCGELLVGGTRNVVTRTVLAQGACPRCQTPLWRGSDSSMAGGAP